MKNCHMRCHAIIPIDKVHDHIGLTRDSLSTVDEQLNVDDVCAIFGQHVKFIVSQTLGRQLKQ